MKGVNKTLSILGYYFSEYDMDAVTALGYKNRTQAFESISVNLGKDNNYLKLRRDEFDALPTSSSHRMGWRNRPAAPDVVQLANELRVFNFNELTEIVKSLLDRNIEIEEVVSNIDFEAQNLTEDSFENIINATDHSSTYKIKTTTGKVRVYKTSIIQQLKFLYQGKCQICGCNPYEHFGVNICEAHHIDYFSNSTNNNANNIVILCPNHHRLVHKLNPIFNYSTLEFEFPRNENLKLKLNLHL